MASVSLDQKIAALYVGFFNRAPDFSGLSYWKGQANSGGYANDLALLKAISAGFAAHPQFAINFGSLSNQQFVEQLYVSMLGSAGDAQGINYWTGLINGGASRADIVAEFINGAMLVDLDAYRANNPSMTQAQYDSAVTKQNMLINKTTVAVGYAQTLGSATNIDQTQYADLTQAPAYQASQQILQGVTQDISTVTSKTSYLNGLAQSSNPIDAILGTSNNGSSSLPNTGKTGLDWLLSPEYVENFLPTQTTNGITSYVDPYTGTSYNPTAIHMADLLAQRIACNQDAIAVSNVLYTEFLSGKTLAQAEQIAGAYAATLPNLCTNTSGENTTNYMPSEVTVDATSVLGVTADGQISITNSANGFSITATYHKSYIQDFLQAQNNVRSAILEQQPSNLLQLATLAYDQWVNVSANRTALFNFMSDPLDSSIMGTQVLDVYNQSYQAIRTTGVVQEFDKWFAIALLQ